MAGDCAHSGGCGTLAMVRQVNLGWRLAGSAHPDGSGAHEAVHDRMMERRRGNRQNRDDFVYGSMSRRRLCWLSTRFRV